MVKVINHLLLILAAFFCFTLSESLWQRVWSLLIIVYYVYELHYLCAKLKSKNVLPLPRMTKVLRVPSSFKKGKPVEVVDMDFSKINFKFVDVKDSKPFK